jgi:4'-phosphopantetheinyl transferase
MRRRRLPTARPQALPHDRIDIWSARLDDPGWPSAELLPAAETRRAAGLRSGPVRARWVAARWALRGVLARYLGEHSPAAIELRAGERGKPYLAAGGAALRFNLSHSSDMALLAVVAGVEVGVDLERIEPRENLLALARRALPPLDAAEVEAAAGEARIQAFHAAWTRREAAAKCAGTGLASALPDGPISVANLDVVPGYAAAVAVAAADMPPLRRFEVDANRIAADAATAALGRR